jgi:hypothetical protein
MFPCDGISEGSHLVLIRFEDRCPKSEKEGSHFFALVGTRTVAS